jgi:hypothetical protein
MLQRGQVEDVAGGVLELSLGQRATQPVIGLVSLAAAYPEDSELEERQGYARFGTDEAPDHLRIE